MYKSLVDNNKSIIELFNNNIIICGGLVDYCWIDYQDIWDLDFAVEQKTLLQVFNLNRLEWSVNQQGFDLKRKPRHGRFTEFYQGKFNNTKIDLFIVDTFKTQTFIEFSGSKFNIHNKPIKINPVEHRIKLIAEHLKYQITSNTPDWERTWIKFKHQKANQKLIAYKNMYPDIYSKALSENVG